jgi:hypothetical protein
MSYFDDYCDCNCEQPIQVVYGLPGVQGPPGVDGANGTLLSIYADFYASQGTDNMTVVPGGTVLFDYTLSANELTDSSNGFFTLPNPGIYSVYFLMSVVPGAGGQAAIAVGTNAFNIRVLPYTIVGIATSNFIVQLVGFSYIETTTPNSVLSIVNPTSSGSTLTFVANAGSVASAVSPVTAQLLIQQLM